MKTLLIIEDDQNLLELFKHLTEDYFPKIFLASTIQEATSILVNYNVDGILCDNFLPDGKGIDFLSILHHNKCTIPAILMTGNPSYKLAVDSTLVRVWRFIEKPVDIDLFQQTMSEFANEVEQHYRTRQILQRFTFAEEAKQYCIHELSLSDRELQIIENSLMGDSNDDIARKLFISKSTVKRHFENISSKLQVHSKKEIFQLVEELNIHFDKKRTMKTFQEMTC